MCKSDVGAMSARALAARDEAPRAGLLHPRGRCVWRGPFSLVLVRALYRLQSRLGLTAPEGNALLALALAGLLGVGALEWQERSGVPSETLYTAADSAFAAASRSAPPAAQNAESSIEISGS